MVLVNYLTSCSINNVLIECLIDLAIGGLSTAVPGELKGYWLLHSKYGKMKWNDLFQPAIDMCLNGIQVSENTANMIAKVEEKIINSPTLKLIVKRCLS